jgi:predicted nucleic acid-binding protein
LTTSYLLDSGVLIRDLRHDVRAGRLLNHLLHSGALIASVVTVFEIFRGCRNHFEEDEAHLVFERITPVPQTYACAIAAAHLMRGHPGILHGSASVPDAMIAGSAMAYGARFVTLNKRQFSAVQHPDLDLVLLDQSAADWIAAIS